MTITVQPLMRNAECGMAPRFELGCRIREIQRAGYGMKTALRDFWDCNALVSLGGMRDSFEIDGGLQNLISN